MRFLLFMPVIVTSFSLLSCGSVQKNFSDADKTEVQMLHENYRNYWLENDSTKVVNLFSDSGAIVPPGNKGDIVKGKNNIGAWWFTKNGDTTYPITVFNYRNSSLISSGELAIWEGVADFEWKTKAGDSVISGHSSTTNFMTVCKKENSNWKIFRQIWNVRPSK